MYTPAAIKKILVDFGVCVDDQSAWAIISFGLATTSGLGVLLPGCGAPIPQREQHDVRQQGCHFGYH